MIWSPQQDAALRAIRKWLVDPKAPRILRLFGYAGTGKTTLAREVASMVNGFVQYAAFTGKASLVLAKKGCENAATLHSIIYKVQVDPATGEKVFRLNPDSSLTSTTLLIVDEVSMVGEDLGADVMSFNPKILVLGDPFQLPPVRGEGYFTEQKPDILLTEIHRQAQDNPIIRMSMDVREGRRLSLGQYGESKVINRIELDRDEVLRADQVLVGTNRTRTTYNRRIRVLRGMHHDGRGGDLPIPGDRLVCLKNNRMKGLLNGSLWNVQTSKSNSGTWVKMRVESLDDPVRMLPADVQTPVEYFRGTGKDLPWPVRKHADEFDYGYALTVHKAQGSQFDHVVLFDESGAFRDDAPRHLYTAITRAANRVTVVM